MRWTWDPDKAQANFEKHGVRFEIAQLVFDDPLALSDLDLFPDEERWRTLGQVSGVTLFVVHTWPEVQKKGDEPVGRIISARKATSRERKAYEDGG